MTRSRLTRSGRLITAALTGYLLVASMLAFISPAQAAKLTPGPDATQQWSQDQFMDIAASMLQDENMSGGALDGGQPMSWNETTGDVYVSYGYGGGAILFMYDDSAGTWLNLGAVNSTSQIRHIKEAADGSIIATLTGDRHIMRSVDKGTTWQNVWNMSRGGDCWNIETRGRLVYVAEYGKSTETDHNSIWYSTDCGKAGTWGHVNGGDTFNFTSQANHWHDGWVDPYTNDVYFVGGDANDAIIKSTDGINFAKWGGFTDGASAISGDANNIYIWEDGAPWAIHTYNRTTQEFRYGAAVTNTSGMFYTGVTGHYGVSYGRSVTEGDPARSGHIFGTVDGERLFVIVNQTTIYESCARVMGPVYSPSEGRWFIWYGDNVPEPWFMAFPHRFRDLTREEGLTLEWQRHNETAAATITYKENGLSFDGQRRIVSFAQDYSASMSLKVTGYNVSNLMKNGDGFENIPDLNQSYPYWNDWGFTPTDNKSVKITAERAHTGTYSLKVQTYNSTGNNGAVRYIRMFAGGLGTHLDMVASHYISIDQTGLDQWDGSHGVSSTMMVLYNDYSCDSFNCNGGIGSNFYTLTGNMSANQWTRSWTLVHTDVEKPIIWLIFDVVVYGVGSFYVDDFQIENGTMLTPYIPYSGTYDWSKDVTVSMNGQTHNFGNLYAGQTASWNMGTVAGLPRMIWDIDGSKVVNWTITGTRLANTTNCLVTNQSGFLRSWATYSSPTVQVWSFSSAAILPGSWIDPDDYEPGGMQVSPVGDSVTISAINIWDLLSTTDGLVANWTQNGLMTQVTYYITGLDPDNRYSLIVAGDPVETWASGRSTLLFEVSGNVTISLSVEVIGETSNTDAIKNLIPWGIGLVILFVVIGFAITAYNEGFNFEDFIQLVAFLVIGLSIYTIVTRFFG